MYLGYICRLWHMFMAGASWARLTPLTHIHVHKWANSFRDAWILHGRLIAVARGLKEFLCRRVISWIRSTFVMAGDVTLFLKISTRYLSIYCYWPCISHFPILPSIPFITSLHCITAFTSLFKPRSDSVNAAPWLRCFLLLMCSSQWSLR